MPLKIITTLIFSFLLLITIWVQAQQPSRSDLEKRRNSLLKEIEATQKQLEETKQNKNATLSELKALQAKLNARQHLISNMNAEIASIEGSINNTTSDIQKLNQNLTSQQKRYAQSIRYAYKQRESENMVAFLFSADDFNDAMRRLQYLKKLRNFRKSEGDKIKQTQELLGYKVNSLKSQKDEKSNLLQEEEKQKFALQKETSETNQVVQQLKGKEKELLAQIKKDQQASQKIQNSIKEMIRKEMEIARKKAEEEAKKKAAEELAKKKAAEEEEKRRIAAANKPSSGINEVKVNTGATNNSKNNNNNSTDKTNSNNTVASNNKPIEEKVTTTTNAPTVNKPTSTATSASYKMGLTPEVQLISTNFSSNQGRLPWPVEKGFISGQYGKHKHPLYPSVEVDNIGIDISTSAGAPVRAVFEGTVTKVTNIDGVVVMISHGEYFTIYAKMGSSNVKVGDKVKAKQVIGTAGKSVDGDNLMNFQVWKITGNSFNSVNPNSWIAR